MRYIQGKHWQKAISKISLEERGEIATCAKRYSENAGDDLLAISGLFISILSFLASPKSSGLHSDWGLIGQLVGLTMVGALGSTARVKFISPLVRNDRAVLEMVPPIYAVRPILLFLMMLLVVRFGLPSFLKQSVFFSSVQLMSVDHNFGWLAGAMLTLAAAVVTWVIVYSDRNS